jgi:hypothetical protein
LSKYDGLQVHEVDMPVGVPARKDGLVEKDCMLVIVGEERDLEWSLMQQAIIIGQMGGQHERWLVISSGGVEGELRQKLKLCVIAGSFYSDFEVQAEEEAHLVSLVKDFDA